MATLFEALGWIEADRGAPPPLAIVRPTATRQDANLAVVKAFFAQSSLAMEGFDVGGVLPFWVSGGIMSMQSLQSVASDRIRHALENDPRTLLIKSDPGPTGFFISGVKKYFVGIVDSWLPEEPCSRQSLKPLKSWSSFPSILVKSSVENLASGHRLSNLQEIRDPPSERDSMLSLSLVSVRSLLATQDSSYKLEMWKLSMKEFEWNNAATVVLDMKSQIRHFREQLGFEVPPPLNLSSSSVQLELAISLNSCNLS